MADGTIGDLWFGLDSPETHARFAESLNRDLEGLDSWGEIPEGTTFADIAGVIMDTIFGYTSHEAVPATELPSLIEDALAQLRPEECEEE